MMSARDITYCLDINMKELQKDAVEIFHSGFACSESIIYAIRKHFKLTLSDDAIAMSSGFPWGLGGAGCICGALAGGTMILGYFFGRTEPGDPRITKCFELTNELHDFFKKTCGGTCCRALTRGMEKDSSERKAQCTLYVSEAVKKTAEIIIRELILSPSC
ncbi:MAG: C-GCAxxG-C-C family protein [Muricomes sp.]